MKLLRIIWLSALLLTSMEVSATWTAPVEIKTVYLHTQHGGYGVFIFSDMSVNPAKCSNTAYYVISKTNNVLFNEIYSLMLANYTTGKKVRVWLDNSTCSPHNHPLIIHARTE
ncbi:hypothetical protein [Aliikangiella coralliicola]|uniref:Uncharacterized protein n=1 Tax=Aliikangiella coralliicola TaxID=2592383 RepID=A0A545UC95_9GAMM|nr:hypothetical protein [Aliikangiella coralliicola]TQV87085.1 hypothetical protein FLL46_14870 [Aliikangiella coralliicola]